MSLPGLAARRRITALMAFVLMAGAGLFGLSRMGLDYFPKVDLGEIVIVTPLPGAGPGEVETLVSEPVEDAVVGIEDVSTVESESRASLSTVSVKVSLGADIDAVQEDIEKAVDGIRSTLPGNAMDPIIFALESSMKPLVIVTFSSATLNSAELRRLVEDEIQPVLSRVGGIASADIGGGEIRQINVLADPVLLWERGITMSGVAAALAAVSADQPGGDVEDDGLEVSISLRSGFHDLDQIRQIVVGAHGGVPVRLGDVAIVEDGFQEPTNLTTLNGRSTVLLVFRKSSSANTVNTCRALTDEVLRISEEYSGQLSMDIVYSQEDFIRSSMNSLLVTGLQAILLSALVLLFFLGSPANAGIVSISMPLSFVTTFASMYFFGVNLNIMSLAGLSIAIGMIVDNSVVVLENIHRLRRGGMEALQAADRGASQVGMAVAASTLTTVAVFVPMLFVRGMTGQIFRDLSITIASALLISLFVSMTLIPLLAGMSPHLVKTHRKGSPLDVIQGWLHRLEEGYAGMVSWCVSHRRMTILPVVALFAVAALMARQIPTSFIPDLKEGTMSIVASAPPGTGLHATDSIARAMVDSLAAVIEPGDLDYSYMTVGRSSGIGAAFGSDASSRIDLTLYFADESRRSRPVDDYQEPVREVLEGVPGLEYSLTTGMPIGSEYPIRIAVYGRDLQELRETGARLVEALEDIPGTVDHASSLDEWVDQIAFVPDPAVLSQRGVSPAMLSAEITLGVLGLDVSTFYEEDRAIDVHVSFPARNLSTRERIMGLPVVGAPLASWGTFSSELVPQMIGHRDRSRCVLVSCRIRDRALGDVGADVTAMLDTLDLSGSRWELLGDIPDQKESFASMSLAILAAVLLVYMVMASQFESLLEPFLLIFEIPMALIGVILIHLAAGITLGLTSLVGILMLAGIVVNNGIVLIDFANQIRRTEGVPAAAAVVDAGRKRLRPILMTAGTTVLALVPLALSTSGSSGLWSPMALTVIGGMLVATPLTLLVLPAMYVGTARWHRRGGGRRHASA